MRLRKSHIIIFPAAIACLIAATYVPVEQQFSGIIGLAMFFAFFSGFVTIYGTLPLSMTKSSSERSQKALSFLHFFCLLMISTALGWMLGGLLAFSQTNFLALAVLLYFLGLRLSSFMQYHF